MFHVESDVYVAAAIKWRWCLMIWERYSQKRMHSEAMEQKEAKC
jgi:hypothetical protein